jgi:hypothetical protein
MITKTFAARQEVKKWSEPPPSSDTRKIETSATRPIETPASSPRPPSRAGTWLFIGFALAVFGVGAAYVLRDPPKTPTNTVKTSTTTTLPTVTTASTATNTMASTSTGTSTSTIPTATTSQEVKAAGHLALFGDPGTRALIDGVAKGSCPIADVAVEPGEHDVKFVFDATGDSTRTSVHVKSNQHVKVVADFTGATPSVRVQH